MSSPFADEAVSPPEVAILTSCAESHSFVAAGGKLAVASISLARCQSHHARIRRSMLPSVTPRSRRPASATSPAQAQANLNSQLL